MTPTTWSWLIALFAPPLVVAVLAGRGLATSRLRALAIGSALICTVAGLAPLGLAALTHVRVPSPWPASPLLGGDVVRLSELSRTLVGLPASLWLITVTVTPFARLDQRGLRRTALATVFTTLAFLTDRPAVLALVWVLSTALFLGGLRSPEHAGARRVSGRYLWPTTVLVPAGLAVFTLTVDPSWREAGLWLVVVGVLVRKGIFPVHAWVPEAFEHGRLGPVALFCAPQLGTYVAATLVVPHATPLMLEVTASLSLVTAIYGAALAVVQSDARRACGYLFVSQSALVLAGLHAASTQAMAGALVLWVSSALAFTGLARIVLALEARRGRLDLRRHHGGFEQMPMLAASFLVLGMACTGFPGTLGFVGEELLVDGVVRGFPVLGFLTVGASAFTGLAILRMYFSLFCGARSHAPETRLLRREAIVFVSVAAVLVATGIAPRAIVRSLGRASDTLLHAHDGAATGIPEPGSANARP